MSHHRHVWAGCTPLRLGRLLEEQKQFLAPGPLQALFFRDHLGADSIGLQGSLFRSPGRQMPEREFVLHFPKVIKRNFQYGVLTLADSENAGPDSTSVFDGNPGLQKGTAEFRRASNHRCREANAFMTVKPRAD